MTSSGEEHVQTHLDLCLQWHWRYIISVDLCVISLPYLQWPKMPSSAKIKRVQGQEIWEVTQQNNVGQSTHLKTANPITDLRENLNEMELYLVEDELGSYHPRLARMEKCLLAT